jgi:hypothetical protein
VELLESRCVRPRQARHRRTVSERITFYEKHTHCDVTVPESYLFHSLGLALSEKQMPRFVGNIDS